MKKITTKTVWLKWANVFFFFFRIGFDVSMSWSQLVHPAQLSSGPTSHSRLNGGSSSSGPGSTPNESYSSMGLSSNAGFHSAETAGTRLPPLHLSQFRMSLSPANFRPIRDPDHYEKIDQIGKGKHFENLVKMLLFCSDCNVMDKNVEMY